MNCIIAEAISHEAVTTPTGEELYHARTLDSTSHKHIAISKILESPPVSYFLRAGQFLAHYLKIDQPIVFVTDWTDPTELKGLRLESDGQLLDYPDMCFLAFHTKWEDISASGIENIFAHEFSHMWLSWLGFDFKLSLSNKFHTSTAITDFYMAFSEGLAEWLEIVTKDLRGYKLEDGELWDYAFDNKMWLCARDSQLRYHAVINNRFIYQTAIPYEEDFDTYFNLHMAHITSTAFTPERLKNGSQMLSSEGAVASVFYQIYAHEMFKNAYTDEEFYASFGTKAQELDPICNLLIKIFYAISKIDLTRPSLTTDFIRAYGECFPDEKSELYNIFTKTTHFSTTSPEARDLFGEMYRIGRRGNIPKVNEVFQVRNALVVDLREKLLTGQLSLDEAVYDEIWISSDEEILPTPWEPDEKVIYKFNINTATAIDFMSLTGVTLDIGNKLVKIREEQNGFSSMEEFLHIKYSIRYKKVT
ncbi:MAG: helix-hairpin-helix domain-containing protein [Defluviitaleaceae bacterium]|nr:helix-hairpin-helix domain-containing protein [Defluviitaleaceae bacterium]